MLGVNNATVARDLAVANATDDETEPAADGDDEEYSVANATGDAPANPIAAKRKANEGAAAGDREPTSRAGNEYVGNPTDEASGPRQKPRTAASLSEIRQMRRFPQMVATMYWLTRSSRTRVRNFPRRNRTPLECPKWDRQRSVGRGG